jgi:spore coat polysaccharide biosynthesis predicted glycosyltransferase SpsG
LNICFITDGGPRLGMGHVQQSTTLAQELAPRSQITFLTRSDEKTAAKIRERGFPVTRLENDAAILDQLQRLDPDTVVFDKIDVAEDLVRGIRETLAARLVIFTNLTPANRHAHVAVTADIGSRFENVRFVDADTGTLYLYGPRYWVLRPEFYQCWKRGKQRTTETTRIMILMGGSDPANLTSAVLDQLLKADRPWRIEVVVGAHYHHDVDLHEILQRHERRAGLVTQHRDIDDVAQLMYASDLVIASPGLSAFEALRVGTPIILVPHNDLQRDTYLGFMSMVERHELGRLSDMIDASQFTSPDDEKIARMQIGEGITDLIELVMAAPGKMNA